MMLRLSQFEEKAKKAEKGTGLIFTPRHRNISNARNHLLDDYKLTAAPC